MLRDLSSNAVLASGAVLGALALVFQGLLRNFVAGLVLLLDDRYAIGDVVEIGGRTGEVVDVGVLSTEPRGADQRVVVVVPNSHCEQVVNHTKLRSGAEVTVLLPRSIADLPGALALISDELAASGADPRWAPKLLEPPRLLGIEARTEHDLQVKALLARLVERPQGWPRRAGKPQRATFKLMGPRPQGLRGRRELLLGREGLPGPPRQRHGPAGGAGGAGDLRHPPLHPGRLPPPGRPPAAAETAHVSASPASAGAGGSPGSMPPTTRS